MTESKLWSWFRDNCPDGTHKNRVENKLGEGMPDSIVTYKGKTAWMELKVVKGNNTLVFRPNQPNWIRKEVDAGGRIFIVAARGENSVSIWHGRRLAETKNWTVGKDSITIKMPEPCLTIQRRGGMGAFMGEIFK